MPNLPPDARQHARQHAPATERNRDAILAVLRDRLSPVRQIRRRVLEVAAGSGEHAVYFSKHLPEFDWHPTDADGAALASIEAWRQGSGLGNLIEPVLLDVTSGLWPVADMDAVVCINMIHISPWAATEGLMQGAGRVLRAGGILYLYGPYKVDGQHTAPSNERFEGWLKDQNPAFGVRDMAAVQAEAEKRGLSFAEARSMPANNFSLIFRKN